MVISTEDMKSYLIMDHTITLLSLHLCYFLCETATENLKITPVLWFLFHFSSIFPDFSSVGKHYFCNMGSCLSCSSFWRAFEDVKNNVETFRGHSSSPVTT